MRCTSKNKECGTRGDINFMLSVSFLALNVNRIRKNKRRKMIMKDLINLQKDVYILTETNIKDDQILTAQREWTEMSCGTSFWTPFVAVLVKNKEITMKDTTIKFGKRCVITTLTYISANNEVRETRLVAIYSPANPLGQIQMLPSLIQQLQRKNNTIMMGDFNCVIDPLKDTINSSRKNPYPGKKLLQELIDKLALTDVYRHLNPEGTEMSRINYIHQSGSRIDTAYSTQDLLGYAENFIYEDMSFSDHRMMSLDLVYEKKDVSKKSKKHVFKYKTFMKHDEILRRNMQKYLNKMNRYENAQLIKNYQKYKENLSKWLKECNIRVGHKNKQLKRDIQLVKNKMSHLHKNCSKTPGSGWFSELQKQKRKLITCSTLYKNYKSQFTQQWYANNWEKSTKLFFKCLNSKAKTNNLNSIYENETLHTEKKELERVVIEFYSNLLSEKQLKLEDMQLLLNDAKLKFENTSFSDQLFNNLENEIQETEVIAAIK
jgi:hypothetical protein